MNIGIIGAGDVGRTLAAGFAAEGHQIAIGTRSPDTLAEWSEQHRAITVTDFAGAAEHGIELVLAVNGAAALDVLRDIGAERLDGKVVLDVTDPFTDGEPVEGVLPCFTDLNHSLMEQYQEAFPQVRFVKAFNHIGYTHMIHPEFDGGPPTMLICGNDDAAKAQVTALAEQVGWEVQDWGTVVSARALEPLGVLWCIPGFRGQGWDRAFKLLT